MSRFDKNITGKAKKRGTYARIPQNEERLKQEDFDEFFNKKTIPTANDQIFKLIDRRKNDDDE